MSESSSRSFHMPKTGSSRRRLSTLVFSCSILVSLARGTTYHHTTIGQQGAGQGGNPQGAMRAELSDHGHGDTGGRVTFAHHTAEYGCFRTGTRLCCWSASGCAIVRKSRPVRPTVRPVFPVPDSGRIRGQAPAHFRPCPARWT